MTDPIKLALFDLDGVLANDDHRVQYAIDRQWVQYFNPDLMAADGVHDAGRKTLQGVQDAGWIIGYLTARRDDRRYLTENWLDQNAFPPGRLIMKSPYQRMRAGEYKALEIGNLLALREYESLVLFDDDPEVIRTVGSTHGEKHVIQCSWSVKPEALIKYAVV